MATNGWWRAIVPCQLFGGLPQASSRSDPPEPQELFYPETSIRSFGVQQSSPRRAREGRLDAPCKVSCMLLVPRTLQWETVGKSKYLPPRKGNSKAPFHVSLFPSYLILHMGVGMLPQKREKAHPLRAHHGQCRTGNEGENSRMLHSSPAFLLCFSKMFGPSR